MEQQNISLKGSALTGTTRIKENYTSNPTATATADEIMNAAKNGRMAACRHYTPRKEESSAEFVHAALKSILKAMPELADETGWYTKMDRNSTTTLGLEGKFTVMNATDEAKVYIDVDGSRQTISGWNIGKRVREMMAMNDAFGTDDFMNLINQLRNGEINAGEIN